MPSYVRQAYEEVEKLQRINGEIKSGEFLRVVELRKADGVRYVGTVGEILKTEKKKKSKPFLDEIDEMNFRSVLVEKAVEDAVKKTRTLLAEKKEIVKQNIVEKPVILELPLIALHGGNMNLLLSWKTLRGLVNAES
jgi:hypothetical protein